MHVQDLQGQLSPPRLAVPRGMLRALPRVRWEAVPGFWYTALLIAVLTIIVRAIHIDRAYDVFGDELIYTNIAQNTARTGHVNFYDAPFFLHPPLFFYLGAGLLKLLQPTGNAVHQVYAMRNLNVLLAGLSAALLFLIGRRAAGPAVGIAAAAIFTLEPFISRINSRVLLETSATFWMLLGYYLLLQAEGWSSSRVLRWLYLFAGVAFGCALLTKEATGLLTLLPLAGCFVLGWVLPRRSVILIGGVSLAVYAIYPLTIGLYGQKWQHLDRTGQFLMQKTWGFQRLIGLRQESGFNTASTAHRAPSFVASIVQNFDQFATTYTLILLGAGGIVVLLLSRRPAGRLLAAWAGCAYFYLAYNIKFGTNEEQYFYYLVVPSILTMTLGAAEMLHWNWLRGRSRTVLVSCYLVFGLLFTSWTGWLWVQRQITPDNGMEQIATYIEQHAPPGSRISTPIGVSDYLMMAYAPYNHNVWNHPNQLRDEHVQCVIISSRLVENGYDSAGPELYDWLKHNAERVFLFTGPTFGELSLYCLPQQAPAALPASAPSSRLPFSTMTVPTMTAALPERVASSLPSRSPLT